MGSERVIVGGGPVGTWTAIELARRNPRLDITRYEQYAEYQRRHVLRLEHFSLLLYAKAGADKLRQSFLKDVTGHNLAGTFGRAAGAIYVSTSHLEGALTHYARQMGVNLVQDKVTDPQTLMERHPNCQRFIAADGAHSRMRTALLGEGAIHDIPLQYVAEVKYHAEGRTRPLDFLGPLYKTQKILNHLAFEYVGRERDGVTPVTVRFFLDRNTYDAVPQASFKQPLSASDPRLPAPLADDIHTYLRVRQREAGEHLISDSTRLSKLTLNMYAVNRFATTSEGRNWHLVGDAAIGVPYFRALNAGIIGGSAVAAFLAKDRPLRLQRTLHNSYGPLSVAWEFAAARGKNVVLNAYDWWRGISHDAPLELLRWSEQEQVDLRSNYQRAFRPGDDPAP